MTLLQRSLHPCLTILGHISVEDVLFLFRHISFVGRCRRYFIHTCWVLRVFGADSASYNLKALGYATDELRPNELMSYILCAIHILCRARAHTLAWFDILGPVFCLVSLMRIQSNREQVKKNTRDRCRAQVLRLGPTANLEHRQFAEWFVYVLTLAWMVDGNLGIDPQACPPVCLVTIVIELLNGDWRVEDAIIHHCTCCNSDQEVADKIADVLIALFVGRALPSQL